MPSMNYYRLLLATLVVWRITHLLAVEAGPWNVLVWMRQRSQHGFLRGLFACFYCLSLWVAGLCTFVIHDDWKHRLALWPAISAGAILLERFSEREPQPAPAYYEDQESQHVLRQEPEIPSPSHH